MREITHPTRKTSRLAALGPGILIAATGVGAGDLLTAGLGGSAVGYALLWAALVGAILKWFLTEGVARWQMATDTTLIEGWVSRLGHGIQWIFLGYLLIWSFFTGGALVTACGVAGTAVWPLTDDPNHSKIIWGVLHSIIGVVLVRVGGFKLFEKLMAGCIGVMFVTVLTTAALSKPDWSAVARGLFIPTIPNDLSTGQGGLKWVLGVLGGVGGTVTVLSYGYWIREKKRAGVAGLRACRVDLAVGYMMTALFGIAMIMIGAGVELERGGGSLALVALDLATQLGSVLGPFGKWVFLAGFWGAVFSSLLGVWQSIPYLFADFVSIRRRLRREADAGTETRTHHTAVNLTSTRAYGGYLIAIALVPLPLLWASVKQAQLAYAVLGSLFMPLLALTLLLMNRRVDWVGTRFKHGVVTVVVLLATIGFFGYVAADTIYTKLALLVR